MVVVLGFSLDSPLDEPGDAPVAPAASNSPVDHPYLNRDFLRSMAITGYPVGSKDPEEKLEGDTLWDEDRDLAYHFTEDQSIEPCRFRTVCRQSEHYRNPEDAQRELLELQASIERYGGFSLAGLESTFILRKLETLFGISYPRSSSISKIVSIWERPRLEALLLELADLGMVECDYLLTARMVDGALQPTGDRAVKWTELQEAESNGSRSVSEVVAPSLQLTEKGKWLMEVLLLEAFRSQALDRISAIAREDRNAQGKAKLITESLEALAHLGPGDSKFQLSSRLIRLLRLIEEKDFPHLTLTVSKVRQLLGGSTREAQSVLDSLWSLRIVTLAPEDQQLPGSDAFYYIHRRGLIAAGGSSRILRELRESPQPRLRKLALAADQPLR